MNKIFECEKGCKKQYLEMVVLGCKKCIKKFAPYLTEKQTLEIVKILNSPSVRNKK